MGIFRVTKFSTVTSGLHCFIKQFNKRYYQKLYFVVQPVYNKDNFQKSLIFIILWTGCSHVKVEYRDVAAMVVHGSNSRISSPILPRRPENSS